MAAQPACDTQQIALWWSKRSENVIIHTDWGFVRFSGLSGIIEAAWPVGQHERKGCCYVSALAESFFYSLKMDCIDEENFSSTESKEDSGI